MKKGAASWLNYIEATRNKDFEPEELMVEGKESVLNFNQQFLSVFHHSIPIIYMLDYRSGKYMSMSHSVKSLLGYTSDDFMREGVSILIDNYHKEDLKLYNEKIFSERLSILKQIPATEHKNHIFSYNFRIHDIKGRVVNLLQRNCFMRSDENGNPLIAFGMVINVDHYRNSTKTIQVVDKINPDYPDQLPETIMKNLYYANQEDQLLTKREKEVLLWMADGLSTKEIAARLFVSEHTVINHRRNMNQKTNTPNATALVGYAIKNGII